MYARSQHTSPDDISCCGGHATKQMERRAQHSKEMDKNTKLLAIPAYENGTQITPESIFSSVSF